MHCFSNLFWYRTIQVSGVAYWLRRCATSRAVPGSIPGGGTWDFFRSSFRQNHVPRGRLSLWKWVPGISPGVKVTGAYGWRPTTLVVPNVEMIWGLNLPGTPRPPQPVAAHLYFLLQMFVLWPFNHDAFWSRRWAPSFRGCIPPPSWYQKWLKVEINVPPKTSASPTWLQGSGNQEYHSIDFFTVCFAQLNVWWILPRRPAS